MPAASAPDMTPTMTSGLPCDLNARPSAHVRRTGKAKTQNTASGSRRNSRNLEMVSCQSGCIYSSRSCRPVNDTNTSSRVALCVVSSVKASGASTARNSAGSASWRWDTIIVPPPSLTDARRTPGRPSSSASVGTATPSRTANETTCSAPREAINSRGVPWAMTLPLSTMATRSQRYLRLVHVVRGQQDRLALLLEAAQQVPDLTARLRIESGRGLVQKQKVRFADQGAGQSKPLLLPTGQFAVPRRAFSLESDAGDQCVDGGSVRIERPEQPDDLLDTELVVELRFLKLDPEALPKCRGVADPPHAENLDVTGVRREQTLEDFDRGCLAGAIRPEQSEAFAAPDLEVEAVDRQNVAVPSSRGLGSSGQCGVRPRRNPTVQDSSER